MVLGLGAWFKHDNRIYNVERDTAEIYLRLNRQQETTAMLVRSMDKLTFIVDEIQKHRPGGPGYPQKDGNGAP